ncbi:glutathione S-transferase 2-like [Manduca sexta]|uniref:glutathione transferase n=1 Tax=Manduca sexta TaxID=7130 RepID=A0A922CJ28_MANSE|nr:glutathione S-transferase 2-like [Manduca sexta]XP_030022575.1 glutathione S-transferase 2-like [Manduca sexta]KAG6447468.1 hypothetical protein O3G_MSEX004988 [Manduca sexta]KAG6447469.1 hypothetical protein O3G_MSEX004988 [Manduca sexta]
MPKVAVYYFPLKALAEGLRMLLAYGGQEFDDKRITKEDFAELKPKMPFGQMPVLEIDGKQYAQSTSIARYLGHKYGLAGNDIEEDFEIDQVMEFLTDIRMTAATVRYEQNEELKAKKQAELLETKYPFYLKKLDEIITKNNGFLALGRLTWADFVFAGLFDCLKVMLDMPDLEEKHPVFKKPIEAVLSIPKVKAYVDAAPETPF